MVLKVFPLSSLAEDSQPKRKKKKKSRSSRYANNSAAPFLVGVFKNQKVSQCLLCGMSSSVTLSHAGERVTEEMVFDICLILGVVSSPSLGLNVCKTDLGK